MVNLLFQPNSDDNISATLLYILYYRIVWIWWRLWNAFAYSNRNCNASSLVVVCRIYQHVAISQMTPGPIGINSATYCGYAAVHNMGLSNTMAIFGSITATSALVLPSLILMLLISKMFLKYMKTPAVQSIFYGIAPSSGWLVGCCYFVALQCRKLLAAKYKCVAIFY